MSETATDTLEPAEVEAIVRTWIDSYSAKDFETHNDLIHPDVEVVYPEMSFVDPEMKAGRDFLVKTLEEDEVAFVDLAQEIFRVSVVGNTAFVEGRFVGSTLGGSIKERVSSAGMNTRFLHRIDIVDGKVRLVHSYYDTALFYQIQLGLEGPTKENPIAPWMLEMSSQGK